MTSKKFINSATLIAAGVGLALGIAATLILGGGNSTVQSEESKSEKPLYWVAPMDPNYRRDKPGKSPMGMDLIPVYEEGEKANDEGPGTINISPDVINNLGVRTGLVERKPLHSEIVTVGYVRYDEDKLIHIHPRLSGWVEKLYVKSAGDPVKKGEPLYALYSPELVNAQEELLLAISRNNTRLIQAAEDRLRALQIPREFINQLKKTKAVQQTITFFAPQGGVVDNLNIREGFYVQPGTTMLSIGALDPIWVEAEIFERQAALVEIDDPVTMTLDYLPGRTWTGRVDYVYPTLDSKTRTVRLRLRFDNPKELLKPNMFAQITVHTGSDEEMLVVPREALIRTGTQDRLVLALGEGSFKSISVKIGRQDQNWVEILEGVDEGEKVVTSAQFLLDSESSKTSDFKRLHHGGDKPKSVWVAAEIQSVMNDHRMVTASHDPIAEWDWPSMTMDFRISPNVDMSALNPGTQLHMEISKLKDGGYEITGIHIMGTKSQTTEVQSAQVNGVVNTVDTINRTANIHRGPIPKWNRPSATMDFYVSDDVDIKQLSPKASIYFEFEIQDGEFVITRLLADEVMPDRGTDHSLDSSSADHSGMDHSQMDHSKMNHAVESIDEVDHTQMDHSSHIRSSDKE